MKLLSLTAALTALSSTAFDVLYVPRDGGLRRSHGWRCAMVVTIACNSADFLAMNGGKKQCSGVFIGCLDLQ